MYIYINFADLIAVPLYAEILKFCRMKIKVYLFYKMWGLPSPEGAETECHVTSPCISECWNKIFAINVAIHCMIYWCGNYLQYLLGRYLPFLGRVRGTLHCTQQTRQSCPGAASSQRWGTGRSGWPSAGARAPSVHPTIMVNRDGSIQRYSICRLHCKLKLKILLKSSLKIDQIKVSQRGARLSFFVSNSRWMDTNKWETMMNKFYNVQTCC